MKKYDKGERIRQVIASYGANRECWPKADQEKWLSSTSDSDIEEDLNKEAALDEWLDTYILPFPDPKLQFKIIQGASVQKTSWKNWLVIGWGPVPALAFAGVASMVFGAIIAPAIANGLMPSSSPGYAFSYDFEIEGLSS